MRLPILAAALVVLLIGCTSPTDSGPLIEKRTWTPVNDVEAPAEARPPLTVYLPSDIAPHQTQRVDLHQFLVVEVAYDACHWADPRLVELGADRIEVRLTELPRMCVRPIPRIAWFSIPWAEVPDPVTIADDHGNEIRLEQRQRA